MITIDPNPPNTDKSDSHKEYFLLIVITDSLIHRPPNNYHNDWPTSSSGSSQVQSEEFLQSKPSPSTWKVWLWIFCSFIWFISLNDIDNEEWRYCLQFHFPPSSRSIDRSSILLVRLPNLQTSPLLFQSVKSLLFFPKNLCNLIFEPGNRPMLLRRL